MTFMDYAASGCLATIKQYGFRNWGSRFRTRPYFLPHPGAYLLFAPVRFCNYDILNMFHTCAFEKDKWLLPTRNSFRIDIYSNTNPEIQSLGNKSRHTMPELILRNSRGKDCEKDIDL